ncbi:MULTISPECIES: NTP transferase domain-containing protein [Halomonadaceae]|uniref:Molybdenum cofactor guanylyltransferase n=1 Tax=Vreelandella halophila TaxID=86177 RepID=A0A9X4YA53_9GAMM|nr:MULTISPECIES: NTP transferase domain-containing protein [Halomonas]MYL26152.1 NTP transferase domain-containing protein [Halomonas utahensis]MYL73286.1 NTP transferase domain-containing protein [Halomonas sp. 22501_18_FS]
MVVGGLILAGGRGERMGGEDKGLLRLDGRSYAAHLADVLCPVTSAVAISANRNADAHGQWADIVLSDNAFAEAGPLAGLVEGLRWARMRGFQGLVVTPCDTPRLPPIWAVQILEAARRRPAIPCLSDTGERRHPLHGYYPVALLGRVERYLSRGERRALELAEQLGAEWMDCSAMVEGFLNVNEPGDQARLSSEARSETV